MKISRDQVKVVDIIQNSEGYEDELYDADIAKLWDEDEFDEYQEFEEWTRRNEEKRDKKYRIGG